MDTMWKSLIQRLWDKGLFELRCSWQNWTFAEDDNSYVVKDSKGIEILNTRYESIAELCCNLPELINRDLRPGEIVHVYDNNGSRNPIPKTKTTGVELDQDIYDKGYRDGYKHGTQQAHYSQLTPKDATINVKTIMKKYEKIVGVIDEKSP